MGYSYDNPLLSYDWNGTYDDGPVTPVVVPSLSNAIRLPFAKCDAEQSPMRFPSGAAEAKESTVRLKSADAAAQSSSIEFPSATAIAKENAIRMRVDEASRRESTIRAQWAGTSPGSMDNRLRIDAAAHRFSSLIRNRWAGVLGHQAATALAWGVGLAKQNDSRMPWANAIAKDAIVRLRWKPGYPFRSGYTIPFGGDPDIPPGTTIVIPPSEIYFMIPALSILRTSDASDLNAIDASVALDLNSFAWTLSATIPRQTLSLVDPNTNSEPVGVTVTINGYQWSFIIEGYTDNRKFGGTGCKIRGRSPTALLGAPYAPLATFTNGTAEDASSLAGDLMPSGFSLTWSTQDWLVPAGLFTYADLAPIDALAQLVNAIGGSILPDQSAQSLTINPMYQTSPWNWSGATPYADVPASFIAELAGEWQGNFKTAYNGIYVSGQNSGIVGLVKLTGTAGDVLLPTVTDQLLCVQAANVERGRIELAKADKKKNETIRVPLLPPGGSGNPGVFQPGELLQITEPTAWASSSWLGQIMSCQIDAVHSAAPGSSLSVRQTLVIERHA